MLITDLKPKGKRQSVVWIDGEPAGFLDNRDISAYRLEAGEDISAEIWQKIVAETILPRGKRKALELLQLQDRTTKELHDKLIGGDYTEDQTREIIAYVASFRYIDEHRYAYHYIYAHAKSKSFREMQQVLLSRGVDPDTIEAAYAQFAKECSGVAGAGKDGKTGVSTDVNSARQSTRQTGYEDTDVGSAEEAAVRRFVSRRVRGASMTSDERRKVYAGLMRKGFSYDAVRRVLAEYSAEETGGEDGAGSGEEDGTEHGREDGV